MGTSEPAEPGPDPARLVDASRRTYLAGERTQLAWWRTGLTALAVALGLAATGVALGPLTALLILFN